MGTLLSFALAAYSTPTSETASAATTSSAAATTAMSVSEAETTSEQTGISAETTEAAETEKSSQTTAETAIQTAAATTTVTTAPETETPTSRDLVVYFSWSGNSAEVASIIAEQTGGDIFEIVPIEAYPEDYSECTDVALVERNSNARPAIQNLPENVDKYDRIYICYPIWWHTAPMIIRTFLESCDLSGIDIFPRCQSASMNEEQFDNSMDFIRECAAETNVHDGLFARASDADAIAEYVEN